MGQARGDEQERRQQRPSFSFVNGGSSARTAAMPFGKPSLAAALFVAVLAGEALAARDWYEARGMPPPSGNRLFVCHGYSCRAVTPVTLSDAELGQISAPLAKAAANPAAERAALSHSVQLFETVVGRRVGTSGDRPRMQFGRGDRTQMDCIDEATNTTSLLRILAARGNLKHHRVLQPTARGFFLDGRYPHATAVLAEAGSGAKWAVDSWPRANGEAPVIQSLREWMRSRVAIPGS
jgi:hypothetical protein